MPTLYELVEEMRELVEMVDQEHESENPEEAWIALVEKELDTVAEHLSDKLEVCGKLVRELTAHAEALKAEKDRFRAREKTVISHVERLKNYMTHAILTLVDPDKKGRRRVETASFLTWVQKNPMSVDVDHCDVVALPEEFVEFVPRVKAKAIIDSVKNDGVIPEGAVLKEEKWSVRIK